MKKAIIINTGNTFFRFKTTKYENYVFGYDEHRIPYLLGKGNKQQLMLSINDNTVLDTFLDFKELFAYANIMFVINSYENYIAKIGYEYYETGNREKYLNEDKFTVEDMFKKNQNSFSDESNLNAIDVYHLLLEELITFFNKYGIPESLSEKGIDGVNLISIIKKLDNLYNFHYDLKSINNTYSLLDVSMARMGVTKDEEGNFQIIGYFNCPFEYTKYNLLVKRIINNRKLIKCKQCKTDFIVGRRDQVFCSNVCRATYSREKKKKTN